MVDLGNLLIRVSRTFALAVSELPEPIRREVEVAYLLFRIADTFEDATRWPPERKRDALTVFERLLDAGTAEDAERHARHWREDPPVDHEGYVELLGETPAVLDALAVLGPEAQEFIRRQVGRTARGMVKYAQQGQELELRTLQRLRAYCYAVAGIVGELLTELFLVDRPELAAEASYLRVRAREFGEGLQLTNILKDSRGDAAEGRSYLPEDGQLDKVFALAREDLRRAQEYVGALERAGTSDGIIGFCALPVLLAWETLDRVESVGSGAKLTRAEVASIVTAMHDAQEGGEPVIPGAGKGQAGT